MRRERDAYFTPTHAVETLLACAPDVLAGKTFIEPCVGEGSISIALKKAKPSARVFTNDLHLGYPADAHFDATYRPCWDQFPECDYVVTNPPFLDALPILLQAYQHARLGVAFLLRLSFLEPTDDRGPWLSLHEPNQMIVLPRISFTGDGNTDSVTCAWMIWRHHATSPGGIRIVDKPRPAKMLLDHIEDMERPDVP
jgi:hypothetical protein